MDLSKYPQWALRFGCRFGGFIFLALLILAPCGFFLVFCLLNLGSTSPNYPRRPPMRSSKAPPNQKNRGQVLPTPSEPSLRTWQVQRSLGIFRHFRIRWTISVPTKFSGIQVFSLFSMTHLEKQNKRRVVLLRCRLLISVTNGVKLSYYRGNAKK